MFFRGVGRLLASEQTRLVSSPRGLKLEVVGRVHKVKMLFRAVLNRSFLTFGESIEVIP